MGLQSVDSTVAGVDGIVRFTQGEHSTFLTPKKGGSAAADNADLLDVFIEMHSQVVGFQVTAGGVISVTDSSDIQAVAQP